MPLAAERGGAPFPRHKRGTNAGKEKENGEDPNTRALDTGHPRRALPQKSIDTGTVTHRIGPVNVPLLRFYILPKMLWSISVMLIAHMPSLTQRFAGISRAAGGVT